MYVDPRGPVVTTVTVEVDANGGPTFLVLSCGHRVERVSHFTYHVGEETRCFTCKKESK